MNFEKTKILTILILIVFITNSIVFTSWLISDNVAKAQIGLPNQPTSQPGSSSAPTRPSAPSTSPSQSVTAKEEFTFFMNNDVKDEIIRVIENKPLTGTTPNPLSQTSVSSRGGQFGNTPIQFRYSSKVEENFIYKATYYCNGAGETSRIRSDDIPDEITVHVSVPLKKGYIEKGSPVGEGASQGYIRGEFSSPQSGKVVEKCLPINIPSVIYVANFNNLSSDAKSNWGSLQTTAVAQAAENDKSGADGGSLTDCNAEFKNPLSWIICPIIDIGAGLTDSVFQDIVKPLLDDVPVSAKPSDPIYQVWQGFRLIANIMLVGSMLIIVYAQTKGGDK